MCTHLYQGQSAAKKSPGGPKATIAKKGPKKSPGDKKGKKEPRGPATMEDLDADLANYTSARSGGEMDAEVSTGAAPAVA